ncbi:MAG: MBG domain-containing protein [Bacteroidales bacterium]|jgi:hypothetical protein|nr:MBG domain-containing protein [Bacteroidales bacterium]
MKKILLLSAILSFAFTALSQPIGTMIMKGVELHEQGVPTNVFPQTVDFKIVTLNGKTWAHTNLNGSVLGGDGWTSQLRFWNDTNGGKVENNLLNRFNNVESWGSTTVPPHSGGHISIFQGFSNNTFAETDQFIYDDAIANTPVEGDLTAPLLTVYNTENVTQVSAMLRFAVTEDNDYFYHVLCDGVDYILFADSLSLTGLAPATLYHYEITPYDFSGNAGTTQVIEFTTPGAIFLSIPTDISITDSTISYTGDANALTHTVTVYRGTSVLIELIQNIDDEAGGILHCQNLPSGAYRVTVQAMGDEVNIMSSSVSTVYDWNFINDNYVAPVVGTSNNCRQLFNTVLFTVETNDNNLVVSIAPPIEGQRANFRAAGFRAENFTVNGITGTWFTKAEANGNVTQQTFTPVVPLHVGDIINYNGTMEYMTPTDGNAYDLGFNLGKIGGAFVWGSRCQRLGTPHDISVNENRQILFSDTVNEPTDVEEYLLTVYNSANIAVATQLVDSGDILLYDVAGGTVTLQAVSNNPDIAASDPASYDWTYTNTDRITYPTGFWNTLIDVSGGGNACTDDGDAAEWTWETIEGKLIITIQPGPTGFADFRNTNGPNNVSAYSLNGVPGTYFDIARTSSNQITLTPIVPINYGDVVSYNGQVTYRTLVANTAQGCNLQDLYPTINFANFGTFVWGTKGPTLFEPQNINVDENRVLTFDGDTAAGSYNVKIYNDQGFLVAEQTVSGSGETILYDVSGSYTIKMQSLPKSERHFVSLISTPYHWEYENSEAPKFPSIFCSFSMDCSVNHGDNDRAVFTWETIDNKLVISIASDLESGNSETFFRGNGMVVSGFSINGVQANDYFTLEINAEKSAITFTPTGTINPGDQITYNEMIEYRTALTGETALWPTVNFANYGSYTWGTTCDYSPQVYANPSALTFTPDTGVRTFILEAQMLTSAVTLEASKGLAVVPTTVTPDENGNILPIDVYVTWEEGGSSEGFVRIKGGGLAFPKQIAVRGDGFSEYCNKIITNPQTGLEAPIYLSITENESDLIFTLAPVYGAPASAKWNNIVNITSNGGQEFVSKTGNGTATVTATFDGPLNTGDTVTFGGALIWTAEQSNGVLNANAYDNGFKKYVVGQGGCDLDVPAPIVRPNISYINVIDEKRGADAVSIEVIIGDEPTYGVGSIRLREKNGLKDLQTLPASEDGAYVLTGLTELTEYTFDIVALDTLGYPSVLQTVTFKTRGTLSAGHFDVEFDHAYYDGTPHAAVVTPKEHIASGIGDINLIYNDSITDHPVNAGEHNVKVAVALGTDYLADTFDMGVLNIYKVDITADSLIFDTTAVYYDGTAHSVSVTTTPAVAGLENVEAVYYNGNTTAPVNAGSYVVSVDISEGQNHNEVVNLRLGTFIINRAIAISTDSFSFVDSTVYNGSAQPVEINADVVGLGDITDIFYNGSATVPDSVGVYAISINIAQGDNYEAVSGLALGYLTIEKATPLALHLDYTPKSVQYDGEGHAVTVYLKTPYKGLGNVTVKYDGATTVPSAVDVYQITVSIDEGYNFLATTEDIVLGDFTISNKPLVTSADLSYEIEDVVYTGSEHRVTVTGEVGDITVFYNGDTTVPVNAGDYIVTVDVGETEVYSATYGLLLDTLIVAKATLTPEHLVYMIPDGLIYNGLAHPVEVSLSEAYSGAGSFTVLYNGGTDEPVVAGAYSITLNMTEGSNFLSVEGLSLGELIIDPKPFVRLLDLSYQIEDVVYTGSEYRVTVTGEVGDITVLYNGDTTAPVNAGDYLVTVNIGETEVYSATYDLLLDTLTIAKATLTLEHLVYMIPDSVVYDEATHPIQVALSEAYSGVGSFTVLYNGSTDEPVQVGTYSITLNVAEGLNFLSVEGLALGQLRIVERDGVRVEPAAGAFSASLTAYIFHDVLYVSSQVESVRLLNVSGTTVLRSGSVNASVAHLAHGLYIAVLKGADGRTRTVKVVK